MSDRPGHDAAVATESVLTEQLVSLMQEFERIDSAATNYEFQIHLADAISAAETEAFANKNAPEREHLRRLRRVGDGLAWRLLHPYTIRQLAKNSGGSPPAISNQSGFAATMRLAKEWSDRGEPVVICDLTNCLRIADAVVCTDPEQPLLLESGGHPAWSDTGRKGRQKRRRQSVSQLLEDGHGDVAGQDTVTLAVDTPVGYSWPAAQEAIDGALDTGVGMGLTGRDDVIVALRNDTDPTFPAQTSSRIDAFTDPSLGFISMLDRPDPRTPPPGVWPISLPARIAVICSKVFIVHAVDAAKLCGHDGADCAIESVQKSKTSIIGFRTRVGAESLTLAPTFLDDVLSGFQTLESTRQQMLAFARAAADVELAS